jgi:hypothetical protein
LRFKQQLSAARDSAWLAPAAVLALALFMRLVRIDLAQFDIDQVKLLDPAQHFIQTGELPLVGGTTFSVGINIPPLITYLLALQLVFTHNALWLTAFQATVDIFGAVFVYAAVRQCATPFAAFAAGAFYAVLPDAILNSRAISNGGTATFLCAVCLWGLVGFLKSGDARRMAVALLAFGLAAELHVTVAVLAPALLLVAGLRWRDLRWQPLATAAGILVLTIVPYLYFQLDTGFSDVKSLTRFVGGAKPADATAFEVVSAIAGGSVQDHFSLAPLDAIGWLVLGVVVAGLAMAVHRHRQIGVLLALWLALPILATLRHAESLAPHYYFGIFPALAMLAGLGFGSLPFRPLAIILLAAFLPLRAGQWLLFQQDLAAGNLPADHSVTKRDAYVPLRYAAPYNVPLRYELLALKEAGPLYVGPREGYDQVSRFLSGGRLAVVGLNGRHTTLLPKDGALLMLDGAGESPLQPFASPAGTIDASSGKPFYSFFRLDAGWLDRFNASLALQPMDARFGDAARLTGLSLSPLTAGQPSKLLLEWQLDHEPRQLHLFARLVDASGKPSSSDPDADIFAGTQWSEGDAVLSEAEVTPAKDALTGGYFLELGLYDATGVRLPVNGAGAELRLGPSKVRGISPVAPTASPKAIFGAGEIALDAVQFEGDNVVLTWTALSKPRADYTVFIHALDASGKVVAQHDGPPVAGGYPTLLWDAREVIRDAHQLQGSLAGASKLEIGLYSRPDLARLPLMAPGHGSAFEVPLTG